MSDLKYRFVLKATAHLKKITVFTKLADINPNRLPISRRQLVEVLNTGIINSIFT